MPVQSRELSAEEYVRREEEKLRIGRDAEKWVRRFSSILAMNRLINLRKRRK